MAFVPYSPTTRWSPLSSSSNDWVPQARERSCGTSYGPTTPSNTMKKLCKEFDSFPRFSRTRNNSTQGEVPKTPSKEREVAETDGVVPDEMGFLVDDRPCTEDNDIRNFGKFDVEHTVSHRLTCHRKYMGIEKYLFR
eukprot:CFRG2135T1